MTRYQSAKTRGDTSTSALEAVLRAEGAAEERIRQSRRDAAAVLAAARARADTIKRRADARIARAHVSHMARIDAEIARVEAAMTPATSTEPDEREAAAFARVVARLAAELTGGSDEVGA